MRWASRAGVRKLTDESSKLDCHRPDFFFHFGNVNHGNGIPRTAIEEAAVRAFAEAFLAADAKNRIDGDAAEGCAVFVRHPEHAVFHRAILHAGRRSGASGAAFCDDGKLFRLLLARRGQAFGLRLPLHFVRNHPYSFGRSRWGRHGEDYTPESLICGVSVSSFVDSRFAPK